MPYRLRSDQHRYGRAYYASRKAEGACTQCGQPAIPGRSRCEPCAKRDRENARKRMRRLRPAWRDLHVCAVCGCRIAIQGQAWCAVCAERTAEYKKRAREAA